MKGAESPNINRIRSRAISLDAAAKSGACSNGLQTPLQKTPKQCSTPPTVSPSKKHLMQLPELNLQINKIYFSENMETSQNEAPELSGTELLSMLSKLNESMLEKEQDLISIKLQLKILESNINTQVEEFIQSLAVSHDNLHSRFLEVKQNNDELNLIKQYIRGCQVGHNSFTYKKILKKLGIKSIEEVYDLSAIKKQNQNDRSVTASLRLDQQRSEVYEEDKYTVEDDVSMNRRHLGTNAMHSTSMGHGIGSSLVRNETDPPSYSAFKRASNPIKINSLSSPVNKREQKVLNKKKLESFEDDSFKFGSINAIPNSFNVPENKDPSRKRATSNSLLESAVKPTLPNPNNMSNANKRFKENEASTIDNSGGLPTHQHLGGVPQTSGLPFAPNLQINQQEVCQMLIRKLAANGGLNNLNDIFRILPDHVLSRRRSNTE